MLVAEVGEPPDVAEPHRVAEAGQEEVALVVPVASLALHLHHTRLIYDLAGKISPPEYNVYLHLLRHLGVLLLSPSGAHVEECSMVSVVTVSLVWC